MIVQFLLSSRMGTRELEDDELDPSAFEVPREVMNKYGRGPLPPKSQIESDIAHLKEQRERRKSQNQSLDNPKESDLQPPTLLKEEPKKPEEPKSTDSKIELGKEEDTGKTEGENTEEKSKNVKVDSKDVSTNDEEKDE